SSACVGKIPRGSRISTQRIGTGGNPVEYQTGVWERISIGRSRSPYQRGMRGSLQGGDGSSRWHERVRSRSPNRRGGRLAWGERGGVGANKRACRRRRATTVAIGRTASRSSKAA